MGLLRNPRTGRAVALGSRVSVGRAGTSVLQLDSRLVSNEHASLWWEDGCWRVRDNGSRNGTRLDGRALAAGERATLLVGGTLVFGHDEQTWVLQDAGAPLALARCGDGRVVSADGGMLALPSHQSPEVTVYEAEDGTWACEGLEGTTAVRDGSAIAVGGDAWILHLPVSGVATVAAPESILLLTQVALRFRVSRDGEYVEIALQRGDSWGTMPTRTHHELLLLLARARLADDALPAAEQGWCYVDEVLRELRIDASRLNLHIFRARQQLGEEGVAGAAGAIQRRSTTGQVRLAVARVLVEAISEAPATG